MRRVLECLSVCDDARRSVTAGGNGVRTHVTIKRLLRPKGPKRERAVQAGWHTIRGNNDKDTPGERPIRNVHKVSGSQEAEMVLPFISRLSCRPVTTTATAPHRASERRAEIGSSGSNAECLNASWRRKRGARSGENGLALRCDCKRKVARTDITKSTTAEGERSAKRGQRTEKG